MIVAGTGHRPPKLGGYGEPVLARLISFAGMVLKHYKPDRVISGMALGWDTALALAALELKIPLTAAVPCKGQQLRWPEHSIKRYFEILDKAEHTVILAEAYHRKCMQLRNEYMVDNSDYLLALWDGSHGGTYNCVKYGLKKPHYQVIQLWPEYEKFCNPKITSSFKFLDFSE